MTDATPLVSVVIPTHDRLPLLREVLEALAVQHHPLDRLEVIVVADGCSDGTEDALRLASYPFRLIVDALPGLGAGPARNRGAEVAAGHLLIFLDDDVVPDPDLIGAHVRANAGGDRRVVVGPYLLPKPSGPSYFPRLLRRWWEERYTMMQDPAYEMEFRDVLGGNLSIPARFFREVGGFDPRFRTAREDGELGIRMLANGAELRFEPRAAAEHRETTDLQRAFRRAREEGRADVRLAELHPTAMTGYFPVRELPVLATWWLRSGSVGQLVATLGAGALRVLERLRRRVAWTRVYRQLYNYWYWRGVVEGAGPAAVHVRRGSTESLLSGSRPAG